MTTINKICLFILIHIFWNIFFKSSISLPSSSPNQIIISVNSKTHQILFDPGKQVCSYLDEDSVTSKWLNEIPSKSLISKTFHIQEDLAGPTPSYLVDLLSFSAVSAESILPLTNSSHMPSGFNVPLNENNPGQYFWWLYPEQIRLSWTENEHEMRVTWVTFLSQRQQLAYRGILCESMGLNSSWFFLEASTKEFDEGQYSVRIQYIHTVVVKNLDSTCRYEYSVGSTCFWSSLYSFQGRTHFIDPNDQLVGEEVSVIITGDWGGGELGTYSAELMEKDILSHHYDCVFHLGDFAYDLNDREGRQGDDWLNMIQGISARLPYFGVPGNHEVDYNMTHYNNRFKFPANQANEGLGWFYSMNLGPVHFVVFNTEQYFEDALNQTIQTHRNWLADDLKQANKTRHKVPWIVLLTHHSFYCSVKKIECYKQANVLKKDLEELIFNYSVDLILQGHVHNYERDHAVYKGIVDDTLSEDGRVYYNPRPPVYVVNGNAGNYHGHNDPFQKDLPSYFIYGSEDFGYGRLKIFNSSHLFYQQFSSENQEEIDYFWIVKDRNS